MMVLVVLACSGSVLAQVQTGLPTGAHERAPQRYSDVSPDHWAADAINRLTALGVLTGYPGGTFAGGRAATRYELAVVAARLLDLLSSSITQLISDPDFQAAIENAASTSERLDRLERLVDTTADPVRVQELAERLAAVEEHLNAEAGERLFPGLAALDDLPGAAETGGELTDEQMAEILSRLEQQLLRSQALALPDAYFGVFTGYPVAGGLQVGMRNVFTEHLGARFGIGYALPGAFSMELAAFWEWPAAFGEPAVTLYAGPGVLARVGGSAALDLELLLGVEYSLPGGPVSIFGEAGPGFTLAPHAGDAGVVARVGMNYGF